YIDICLDNGLDRDIPWMEDLFLDIVLLPSGEVFLKDDDELEEAVVKGIIDKSLYNLAWDEANNLIKLIHNRSFELLNLSIEHKEILVNQLK
ncbi:DUF402 domain-containing protein, partial [Neobacillus kokaensis]|uniref:DUF402 domain-containing protein n=1 Tax=Neobacillus kokaensis TaxID=2759023 RepID=UPI00174E182C